MELSANIKGIKYTPFLCRELKEFDDILKCTHSRQKRGLLKMILFTNLENLKLGNQKYDTVAVLKLTSNIEVSVEKLNPKHRETLQLLQKEALINKFEITLNGFEISKIKL